MPLISIITTVYNSQKFIIDCLNSVQNQTFFDFEHIIVNDGSTDRTIDKISEYVKSKNLKNIFLINSNKIGRAKALNLGVKNSKSDIICILDSDDLWDSKKLHIQYTYFKKFNLDLLCTNTTLFFNTIDINTNSNYLKYEIIEDNISIITLKKLLYKNIISHSSIMIKKPLCSYNDKMFSQIDYELWLRTLGENFSLKFYYLDLNLNYHRLHENQNFESKGFFYKLNALKLTTKFALSKGYIDVIFINVLKLPYYLISRFLNIINSRIS